MLFVWAKLRRCYVLAEETFTEGKESVLFFVSLCVAFNQLVYQRCQLFVQSGFLVVRITPIHHRRITNGLPDNIIHLPLILKFQAVMPMQNGVNFIGRKFKPYQLFFRNTVDELLLDLLPYTPFFQMQIAESPCQRQKQCQKQRYGSEFSQRLFFAKIAS